MSRGRATHARGPWGSSDGEGQPLSRPLLSLAYLDVEADEG